MYERKFKRFCSCTHLNSCNSWLIFKAINTEEHWIKKEFHSGSILKIQTETTLWI